MREPPDVAEVMNQETPISTELQEARKRFLALVEHLRPDLHRYCARMMGSVAEGEDIVQDTLARAYYELSALDHPPALRGWLFRIAHNRALDQLKRYERRMSEPLDTLSDADLIDAAEADAEIVREQAVTAAVSRFLELAPLQRSCVVLKDVLGYSLEDIATLVDVSVPAVKSALHRGRVRLRELSREPPLPVAPRMASPALVRYATLFNARNWDAVRAMLLEDVRLELISMTTKAGRGQVEVYFTNYGKLDDWHMVPAWLDDREVLAVFADPAAARPRYFIELTWVGDRVTLIRDFRHVPYIGRDLQLTLSV